MKLLSILKSKDLHYAVALIAIAFLVNIIPSKIAIALGIPVFIDSIGTILAGMLGGTLPAVIVGFCSNAFNSISDLPTLYYGIISILIGAMAAIFQQKGYFRTLPKIIVMVLMFAILGGVLGSILTYFLYGYDFGEGVSAPFAIGIHEHLGLSKFTSQLVADFIIDVIDKIFVVAAVIITYHKIPLHVKTHCSRVFLFDPNPVTQFEDDGTRAVKRSLLRRVVVMVITAEILLGVLASTTGFVLYQQQSIEKFTDIAHGLTEAASIAVDTERIDEFVEKGREAEGYTDIEQKLYRMRDGFPQALYLYVYRIQPDGCHVVFDLDTKEGEKASQPGDLIDFDPSFEPYLPQLLKGEPIEPIISDDQYGWLLTVYKPLKNSTGKTVAYIAADISMGEIITDQAEFFIKLLSMFFGVSILIMSIVLEFVNRRIVHPVNRMASAAIHFAYNMEQDRANDMHEIKNLNIHTSDEIEHLYRALTKTCMDSIGFINRLEAAAERIQHMQDEIIINFAEMVEARDTSTGNHIKKTAFYVEAIARELLKEGKYSDVLDEKYIEKLKRSAPLHDIGKIAVSDLILNKPGKLTDEEFSIMKSHTTEGTNILSKIEANTNDTMDDNYLKDSMEMAHYHHEKWDGTGYPTGIKGEEIPLSARIMAVADVFDALVAERVYKKPFTYEKAMAIITEGAGKHFDPTVVEAFCHISEKLYAERTTLNNKV